MAGQFSKFWTVNLKNRGLVATATAQYILIVAPNCICFWITGISVTPKSPSYYYLEARCLHFLRWYISLISKYEGIWYGSCHNEVCPAATGLQFPGFSIQYKLHTNHTYKFNTISHPLLTQASCVIPDLYKQLNRMIITRSLECKKSQFPRVKDILRNWLLTTHTLPSCWKDCS